MASPTVSLVMSMKSFSFFAVSSSSLFDRINSEAHSKVGQFKWTGRGGRGRGVEQIRFGSSICLMTNEESFCGLRKSAKTEAFDFSYCFWPCKRHNPVNRDKAIASHFYFVERFKFIETELIPLFYKMAR